MLIRTKEFPWEHRGASHSTSQHWGDIVLENLPDAISATFGRSFFEHVHGRKNFCH